MKRIILNYYNNNRKENLLSILMFFQSFMMLFFYAVDIHNANVDKETIFTSFPPNAVYISYPFDNTDHKNTKTFLQSVSSSPLISYVGYNQTTRFATADNSETNLVFLTPYLMKFTYPLTDGTWFSSQEDSGIIIGGKLSAKYHVGDKIVLSTDSKTAEKTVIGNMGTKYKYMGINVAGDNLNFGRISIESTDNLILTLDKDFFASSSESSELLALVVDETKLDTISKLGINSKNVIPFQNMHKNNTLSLSSYTQNKILICTVTITIFLFIIYQTYLYILKNQNSLLVMWQQGMSYTELTFALTIPYLWNLCIGYMLHLAYQFITHMESTSTILWSIRGLLTLSLFTCFLSIYFIRKLLNSIHS